MRNSLLASSRLTAPKAGWDNVLTNLEVNDPPTNASFVASGKAWMIPRHAVERLFWSLIASCWWSLIASLCNLPPKLSSARQEEDRGC
jgi:hypothetical protein